MGIVPFLAYVGAFLIAPTVVVVVAAFLDGEQRFTLANLTEIAQGYISRTFWSSFVISAASAVIGAVLGAVLAYVVATGNPTGAVRQAITSACGVLAQFGGVTLAFAFIATVGGAGLLTTALQNTVGVDISGNWLYELTGLVLVYSYFQIPLMVLVFLPALDGVRPQWREATETLGGTTWDYWRSVAFPILTPPFLGALLLLFANAFSAYATAAALISQGAPIVPLQIRTALTSEVLLGRENVGKALALGMIIVVAIVMALNAYLQKRASRWLR
ncbi:MAG: ABC transporter permease subunit [Kineosporiaceae bacterium]|nr:ABC transporter permease subunit [Kineosporiaceae bacterium]